MEQGKMKERCLPLYIAWLCNNALTHSLKAFQMSPLSLDTGAELMANGDGAKTYICGSAAIP